MKLSPISSQYFSFVCSRVEFFTTFLCLSVPAIVSLFVSVSVCVSHLSLCLFLCLLLSLFVSHICLCVCFSVCFCLCLCLTPVSVFCSNFRSKIVGLFCQRVFYYLFCVWLQHLSVPLFYISVSLQ
jgi:hypothetical protein